MSSLKAFSLVLLSTIGAIALTTNFQLPQASAVEANKGGQVLEVGTYHLEFVPEKEANGTHLDFYLQNGSNHQSITNAKVTAQVQMPDGTKKNLPFTYDTKGKHYTALLDSKASGDYKVAILCDIGGKKVNGRFSFKR